MADEITRPRPEDDQEMHDIQILIKSDENPQAVRTIKASIRSLLFVDRSFKN